MRVPKKYLLVGSFSDLKDHKETNCVLVDEDFIDSLSLSDLEGAALVPFECAVTAEDVDGVLKRVCYCRDVNHKYEMTRFYYGRL
jgi:hypothetical protein